VAMMHIGSLEMQLNRKPIKNLHISVLPPDGKIRVSAPEKMTDNAIRMTVIKRIPWIKKQKEEFASQPRQSVREFISGENHYLWGRRYRLEVIEKRGNHKVIVSGNNKIKLNVNPGTKLKNKEQVLNEFYRRELNDRINTLLPKWIHKVGKEPVFIGIKKMKTKWGSCNTQEKRIWLNLELAKKAHECTEYILLHELIHLIERKHNALFMAYMDKLMPNWRERRDLLNKSPLAFSDWSY